MLLVVGGVVAAEHGRTPEQGQLAGADVVVVDRRRDRHGRVAEPHPGLGERRVPARADGVDLLVELDQVVVAEAVGAELEDPELGEPVAALVHDQVAGEGVDLLEPHRRVVRHQRAPRLRLGRLHGRDADLEVGARVVVEHEEHVLARDHGVLEAVLQAVAARGEHPEALLGPVGVEEAVLGGGLGARGDDQEPVGAAAADADPEPPVLLVVDQLVVGLGGAEPVPPDLVGAPALVDGRVVEVLAVAGPRDAAEDAGDHVVEQLAGAQVLDPDGVALVAGGVGRVGQQVGVGADRRAAEREEVVALGELVEVEQELLAGQRRLVGADLLGGLRGIPVVLRADRHPAAGAVLAALEGAAVVPVAAVAGRHRQVGLEGAGLDLVEDRLAQVLQVRGALAGVGVLGLEVGRPRRGRPWRASTRSRPRGRARGDWS